MFMEMLLSGSFWLNALLLIVCHSFSIAQRVLELPNYKISSHFLYTFHVNSIAVLCVAQVIFQHYEIHRLYLLNQTSLNLTMI